jgi:FkbM family methyltransferase
MKLRRAVIDVLDRPGGRTLLGYLATRYARMHGAPAASIYYDGAWIRGDGAGRFSVDSTRFDYWTPLLADFQREFETIWSMPREIWLSSYSPKLGDVMIDIGAGVGHDVLSWAPLVGPEGLIVAVEAHPTTFRMLDQAIRLNRLPQVRPVQVAILAAPGEVALEDKPGHMENRIVLDSADASGQTRKVRGTTMDQLVRDERLERIDFLKMNIEGAERLAIQCMDETLERTRHVCIACHDFIWRANQEEWYRTKDLVSQYLTSRGFSVSSPERGAYEPILDQVHGARR